MPQPTQPPAPAGAPPQQSHQIDLAGLHNDAVAAEGNLEKLATGLAQAGANPQVVQAVGQMAHTLRQVVQVLGGSAGAAQPGAPAPGAPAPGGPAPPAAPPAPPEEAHAKTIHGAAQDLKNSMLAAAAARNQQAH